MTERGGVSNRLTKLSRKSTNQSMVSNWGTVEVVGVSVVCSGKKSCGGGGEDRGLREEQGCRWEVSLARAGWREIRAALNGANASVAK